MDGFKGQGQLDHVTSRALSVDEKQAGVVSAAAKTVCTVFFFAALFFGSNWLCYCGDCEAG
jgi:hypothetical protein